VPSGHRAAGSPGDRYRTALHSSVHVSTVLERVRRLIALSASPNENEARTAAVLAVQLIRQHRLVLSLPSGRSGSTTARRRPSSGAGRDAANPAERIRSPLGGECTVCGGRYRSGQTVYWFAGGGGMHPECYERPRR
jgi:hypothetical protein